MKLTTRDVGAVTVIDFAGRITIGEGEAVLHEAVAALLERDRTRILLNLEDVTNLDSSGMGELVACYKDVNARGGALKLLRPSPKLMDLLQIAKLEDLFEIYASQDEAIDSY